MGYRILVDENLDPRTARHLDERGHDAVHVATALEKGTADPPIARHVRQNDMGLLTNDADFLRAERREGVRLLYVPDSAMPAHRIATLVDELAAMIPDQADLPEVTWITRSLHP